MHRHPLRRLGPLLGGLLTIALAAPGCHLYFEQDPDGDSNVPDAGIDPPWPEQDAGSPEDCWGNTIWLRSPESGACEPFDDPADPCSINVELPTWGSCSACSQFYEDELGCLATAGCRAAYVEGGVREYLGCWAADTAFPGEFPPCADLAAASCSARDDCVPVHEAEPCNPSDPNSATCGYGWFVRCDDEPTGCHGDEECAPGWGCTAGSVCGVDPACYTEPSCDTSCYGLCVPEEGSCYGEVLCPRVSPVCPPGSVPGIANNCWTGACIETTSCEGYQPPVECEQVTDEDECLDASGCIPVYRGLDCSCGPDGCGCDDWVFERCTSES